MCGRLVSGEGGCCRECGTDRVAAAQSMAFIVGLWMRSTPGASVTRIVFGFDRATGDLIVGDVRLARPGGRGVVAQDFDNDG